MHKILFFLQHCVPLDAKKSRTYHSFSPRKWSKHCYLQGFLQVIIFDFLKTCKNQCFFFFFAAIKTNNRFTEGKIGCNLQAFGAFTGKTTV
jgi:hypothetical protein